MMMLTYVFIFVYLSFSKDNSPPVYELKSLTKTANGMRGVIELIEGFGPYGNDIQFVGLEVYFETQNRLRVKMVDMNDSRWEVFPWIIKDSTPSVSPTNLNYDIFFENKPFGMKIVRKEDNFIAFNCSNLVYSNQYLSVLNTLTSKTPYLYGFADRVSSFQLDTHDKTYTLFNFPRYAVGDKNLYSSHPFYMEYNDGKANGVFLFNTNAMNIHINKDVMEYRTIGGILDFFFFMGSSPDDVVKQYHTLIGKPHFPPRWSFGWHQCRYGYKDVEEVFNVVKNYEKYEIPLDGMWTDIDYMDEYKDFTFDPVNFPLDKMKEMVDYIHDHNKHYVLITDPGIKILNDYDPYNKLLESKAFVKTSDGKTPLVNKVWPGYCIFPDFLDPVAHEYWFDMLSEFHSQLPIDGLWIDMNEIEGFCDGSCNGTAVVSKFTSTENKKNENNFDPINPPYLPTEYDLDHKTIRMDALHYGGEIEYNVHNLYGMMEMNATSQALERIRKNTRSFVLGRSTWAGTGHLGSHWTGDNLSDFVDLRLSIPNLLKIQMSGVAHVGADVCGFGGETNRVLCERWTQLAVFYPFARNHNGKGMRSQEPWELGMQEFAKKQISIRYSLIPFFYSIFFRIHTEGGNMFWKSIWMVFPQEKQSSAIDDQFVVGNTLLVAPYLWYISKNNKESSSSTEEINISVPKDIYFPNSRWYDFHTFKKVDGEGKHKLMLIELENIPAYIRGGKVLVLQTPAQNTIDQELNDYQIIVAMDGKSGKSDGELYLDDGESLDSITSKKYTLIQFNSIEDGKFVSDIVESGYQRGCEGVKINQVKILGTSKEKISSVLINGKEIETFKLEEGGNLMIDDLQDVLLCQPLTVVYG